MAQVNCNDGTTDVDNGEVQPCLAHGGIKIYSGGVPSGGGGGGIPEDHTNDNNPRKDCSMIDFRFHCWRKEAQIGFGIGAGLMALYAVSNKKGLGSVIGLGLLGGLGGIIAASFIKRRSSQSNSSVPGGDVLGECDFPQRCKDGTFGCNCGNHGGVLPAGTCARGQFYMNGTCFNEGNYELTLREDTDVSVMDMPDHYIQKRFPKNTLIQAILSAPADVAQFSTTYDGTLPDTEADGQLWFTLPIEKIDFSKLKKI